MSKSPATWSVIWLDSTQNGKPWLASEIFDDLRSVEARCIAFARDNVDYVVTGGPVLPVTVDTSPRVSVGDKPTPKPRAKRRTKSEMEAARAAKANVRIDAAVAS